MNKEELKPCPFCGNDNVRVYESRNMDGQASDWVVKCMSDKWNGACGAFINYLKEARAIEVWNQRADVVDPALRALAARYNMTWSEFCRALAADRFWPIEPR